MLHPDFPVIEGSYKMTDSWSIVLPGQFNRRIEDGDLIIWRPGFTILLAIWDNDNNLELNEFYESTITDISQDAFDLKSEYIGGARLFSYRLDEEEDDNRVAAFYCFAVSSESCVQAAIYFDSEKDVHTATEVWRSLSYESNS